MADNPDDNAGVVLRSYLDDALVERMASAAGVVALTRCLGAAPADHSDDALVVRGPWRPIGNGTVELEQGEQVLVRAGENVELPLGYHRWHGSVGSREMIVAPKSCVVPKLRAEVLCVQLYAARSTRSWGMGDLNDLRELCRWAVRQGMAHVLVNPLCASAPTTPQEDCPYAPVSRLFGNPLYLRPEDIPAAASTDLSDLAAAGRALNRPSRIDRDAVWQLKHAALRRVFESGPVGEFDTWLGDQPGELHQFATWSALAERFGADTRAWPAAYRNARDRRVRDFAAEHADTVRFYQWLQWLLKRCPEAAGPSVIHDLPVGVRVGGADPWIWPEAFLDGATIGAPPDALNTAGQNWGLAPLHPRRLRANGMRPFIDYVRTAMSGSAGVRIDHILGLSRLWLVPDGARPDEGAYVRYPVDELLAVIALESHRAGAFVIGEDLGTVEPGFRDRLAEIGVLSCRALVLEEQSPSSWPHRSLATVSTHDLPTLAGLTTGADREDLQRSGVPHADRGDAEVRARITRHLGELDDPRRAVRSAHAALRASPSVLVGMSMEDLLGVAHRPNIPTTDWRWNWTRPLPLPVDELDVAPLPVLARADREQG